MYSYEIPKKLGYPKTVFYDDGIVKYYKDGREVKISIDKIERIDYAKPSLFNYLFALGGTFPGRLEVHLYNDNSLLNRASKTRLHLIKISHKDIYKLPEFFKQKLGLDRY